MVVVKVDKVDPNKVLIVVPVNVNEVPTCVTDSTVPVVVFNPEIGVVGFNAYEGDNSLLPANNVPTYIESKIMLGGNLYEPKPNA